MYDDIECFNNDEKSIEIFSETRVVDKSKSGISKMNQANGKPFLIVTFDIKAPGFWRTELQKYWGTFYMYIV